MITEATIEGIITDKLAADEMFLVELAVKPGNKIIVMIDNDNGVPISYCIELSKFIEAGLNRDEEDFELEVASAGIGQPFKVKRQYMKNIGREVEVLTSAGIKFTGKLIAVEEEGFTVEVEEKVKIEGKKRKELQVKTVNCNFDEVKQVKDIISF
ncbi:ribosome assembly cofactor RimP [Carboxylicivirga sediminis]|uniref:Ribosome maturation factor RimP n=1 Tax=Carboxylicivirga sediminis TaxID=2006564 RepID=A0A941F1I6_9BACT|nr:ribosome assembly cofactor RimP [Carboxylicivirga sediminis]MBR8534304.1 ribosome assembly cofactor RimP [Carboxylicivirga sediminis]